MSISDLREVWLRYIIHLILIHCISTIIAPVLHGTFLWWWSGNKFLIQINQQYLVKNINLISNQFIFHWYINGNSLTLPNRFIVSNAPYSKGEIGFLHTNLFNLYTSQTNKSPIVTVIISAISHAACFSQK